MTTCVSIPHNPVNFHNTSLFKKGWGLSRTTGSDSPSNDKLFHFSWVILAFWIYYYTQASISSTYFLSSSSNTILRLHFPFSWCHESDPNTPNSCLWLNRVRPFIFDFVLFPPRDLLRLIPNTILSTLSLFNMTYGSLNTMMSGLYHI